MKVANAQLSQPVAVGTRVEKLVANNLEPHKQGISKQETFKHPSVEASKDNPTITPPGKPGIKVR